MSVPLHQRNLSSAEYLNETALLEVEILQLIKKTPQAYTTIISELFHECCEALRHGKTANAIYVKSYQELENRRYELNQMRGAIDSIPCHVNAWAEIMQQCDSVPASYKAKLDYKEEKIAIKCEYILRLIDGVKRSDTQTYNKSVAGKGDPSNSSEPFNKPKDKKKSIAGTDRPYGIKYIKWMASQLFSINRSIKNIEIYQSSESQPDPDELEEYDWAAWAKKHENIPPSLAHALSNLEDDSSSNC